MNSLSPFGRFALIASTLCRAVAACHGRGLMTVAMIALVWSRVRRADVQFLALVERVRSGRFRGGRVRDALMSEAGVHEAGAGQGARLDAPSVVVPAEVQVAVARRGRLPLGFGWLMRVMPYEAAGYASQLRTVLADPEMVALLRVVAQARRSLGPLCRMLGVEIPGVGPRAPVAVRTRLKRVRAVVDWGRIPLPRGVLAAARRQGFGKVGVLKGG